MRVERTIANVEIWSEIVSALPPAVAEAARFRGEEVEKGFLVSMEASAATAVDTVLGDLPSLQRRNLIAYAADLRWRREVGGIVVDGVPVATDDRSKVMIVGARVAAEANPAWSTTWHGADGQVYPIDAPAMIAISVIVEAHVNCGFATFAQVKADIEAGAVTTRQQVADAFAT